MANIIDQTYLTQRLGADTVQGIWDNGAGGVDTTALQTALDEADGAIYAALERAGYGTISASSLPLTGTKARQALQKIALREVYVTALITRRGISLDTGNRDQVGPSLEALADGQVPIPGYVPDQDGAVGGIVIEDGGTSTDSQRGTTFALKNTEGLL